MGKRSGSTVEVVRALVLPVCKEMGLSLWDVTFEKEGADWFLKVLVEKNDGNIDIDECEKFSRRIDPIIDEADPIEQSYYLEVGSPGLGRKLRLEEHFKRYLGEEVCVRRVRPDEDGNKEIVGKLISFEDNKVSIKTEEKEYTVALSDSAYVKLCDDNIK